MQQVRCMARSFCGPSFNAEPEAKEASSGPYILPEPPSPSAPRQTSDKTPAPAFGMKKMSCRDFRVCLDAIDCCTHDSPSPCNLAQGQCCGCSFESLSTSCDRPSRVRTKRQDCRRPSDSDFWCRRLACPLFTPCPSPRGERGQLKQDYPRAHITLRRAQRARCPGRGDCRLVSGIGGSSLHPMRCQEHHSHLAVHHNSMVATELILRDWRDRLGRPDPQASCEFQAHR